MYRRKPRMTRSTPALPSLLRRAALLLALGRGQRSGPGRPADRRRHQPPAVGLARAEHDRHHGAADRSHAAAAVPAGAAQRQLTAQQQEQLKRIQARTSQTLRQAMSWQQLRPMYVDLYKNTFSKEDVLAMAEFYESAPARACWTRPRR